VTNRAYFDVRDMRIMLSCIEEGDMDGFLNDPDPVKRNMVGYPLYYDCKHRLYPKPDKGIKVVFK
jgi:hypothetical protein